MAKLKYTDTTVIFAVDGMEYPLDIADLTGRETGILKRVGKLKGAAEITEAMMAGDIEALAALVGIAMSRAGIKPNYERLLDLPTTAFETKLPEDTPDPLETRPTTMPEPHGTPSLQESTE